MLPVGPGVSRAAQPAPVGGGGSRQSGAGSGATSPRLWRKKVPAPGRTNRPRRRVRSDRPSPRTDVAGVGALAHSLTEQLLALQFVQPTPDAVRLPDGQCVIEAVATDGAGGADLLGPALTLELVLLALELSGREEDGGLGPTTRCLQLPVLFDPLSAHVAWASLRVGTVQPTLSPGKGKVRQMSLSDP